MSLVVASLVVLVVVPADSLVGKTEAAAAVVDSCSCHHRCSGTSASGSFLASEGTCLEAEGNKMKIVAVGDKGGRREEAGRMACRMVGKVEDSRNPSVEAVAAGKVAVVVVVVVDKAFAEKRRRKEELRPSSSSCSSCSSCPTCCSSRSSRLPTYPSLPCPSSWRA